MIEDQNKFFNLEEEQEEEEQKSVSFYFISDYDSYIESFSFKDVVSFSSFYQRTNKALDNSILPNPNYEVIKQNQNLHIINQRKF
jgi:hypothetical protein